MKGRDGNEASDHWKTPDKLYQALDAEFHFDFDPCPLYANFDGLSIEWGKSNFCNPPYNRFDKPKFIQKGYEEYLKGKLVVFLLPVSTSTKQFHEILYPYGEIRFIRGRVSFIGVNTKGELVSNKKGKHDSMIVILKPKGYIL